MNLAERLRARANAALGLLLQFIPRREYSLIGPAFDYAKRANNLAEKREARRIAAGDPDYVREKR